MTAPWKQNFELVRVIKVKMRTCYSEGVQSRIIIFDSLIKSYYLFDIAYPEVIVSCLLRLYEKQNLILYTTYVKVKARE